MNVLDLPGPQFLLLYLGGMVFVYGWALARRAWAEGRPPGPASDEVVARLTPLEIGYLREGPAGAVGAAVARLVHRGRLVVNGRRIEWGAEGERELVSDGVYRGVVRERAEEALDELVLQTVRSCSRDYAELVDRCTPTASRLAVALRAQGLLTESPKLDPLAMLLSFALVGLGAAKIAVGVSRGRPVVFLVILVVLTIPAAWLRARADRRTGRGEHALRVLADRNEALRTTAGEAPQQLTEYDVALAAGVFGVAILGGTLASVAALTPAPMLAAVGSSASSCGSSCGGSSCGGGCGGGCGGCGG